MTLQRDLELTIFRDMNGLTVVTKYPVFYLHQLLLAHLVPPISVSSSLKGVFRTTNHSPNFLKKVVNSLSL
jgi:hypothetical protein